LCRESTDKDGQAALAYELGNFYQLVKQTKYESESCSRVKVL